MQREDVRLKEDTGQDTEQDLVVGNLEAVGVRRFAQFLLSAQVGTDFVEFESDFGVVRGRRGETGEGLGGIFIAVTLDQVTRRLGEEGHATSEDGSPDELDTGGDLPGRVGWAVLSSVVDNGSEEETDGDGPLVARDDGTTDPLGRAVRGRRKKRARDVSDRPPRKNDVKGRELTIRTGTWEPSTRPFRHRDRRRYDRRRRVGQP